MLQVKTVECSSEKPQPLLNNADIMNNSNKTNVIFFETMVYGTVKIATPGYHYMLPPWKMFSVCDLVPNQKTMSPRLYSIVCFVVLSFGTVIAYIFSTNQKIWDSILMSLAVQVTCQG